MNTLSLGDGGPRFISLSEAALILGTSDEQVETLVTSGELPAIRLGAEGPWRIDQLVLESYIGTLYEETRRHRLWNESNSASIERLP